MAQAPPPKLGSADDAVAQRTNEAVMPEPVWPRLVATIDRARPAGFLAGMRIRKKLIVLHTVFSLLLAAVLVLVMRPALASVLQQAEEHEARLVMGLLHARLAALDAGRVSGEARRETMLELRLPPDVRLLAGTPSDIQIDPNLSHALETSGGPIALAEARGGVRVVLRDAADGTFYAASVRMEGARHAVNWLYVFLVVALLAVYALIAVSLEIFVLPRNVWRPIRAMLRADEAVREGTRADEIIPERHIPADELGQIMRSRNATVNALRENQRRLAEALIEIERVAADLQRKNHLLETAKRNLADADRLASLGVMSAGLAHEINTPLAVVKGLAEKLARSAENRLEPAEAHLLVRVTGRLERLAESLLDFARARPPESKPTALRPLVDEAWTLVALDREAKAVTLVNGVPSDAQVTADPDRLLQVLVNLLRNAADALAAARVAAPRIDVRVETVDRDGARWVSLTIGDNGPGLSAEILGTLFEPFATTRLDARGTGLGLAVSQGIVQEHRGLLTARNRAAPETGAEFEVLLPADAPDVNTLGQ